MLNRQQGITWTNDDPVHWCIYGSPGPKFIEKKLISCTDFHDYVIKWKHFCITGPLWGESTSHGGFLLRKASDVELWCFLWSAPEQMLQPTLKTPGILRCHHTHHDITVILLQQLVHFSQEYLLHFSRKYNLSCLPSCDYMKLARRLCVSHCMCEIPW